MSHWLLHPLHSEWRIGGGGSIKERLTQVSARPSRLNSKLLDCKGISTIYKADLPPTFHVGQDHISSISNPHPHPRFYLMALCTASCAGQPVLTPRGPSNINNMVQTSPTSRKTEKPSLRGNTSKAGARAHTKDPGRSPKP